VYDEGDKDDDPFWDSLGGRGAIKAEAKDLECEKGIKKRMMELT